MFFLLSFPKQYANIPKIKQVGKQALQKMVKCSLPQFQLKFSKCPCWVVKTIQNPWSPHLNYHKLYIHCIIINNYFNILTKIENAEKNNETYLKMTFDHSTEQVCFAKDPIYIYIYII